MFFKSSDNTQNDKFKDITLPTHIGLIMDGNGRWAKKRGLPRTAGHTAGAKVFKEIALYSSSIGIKNLTVYAFSTENWKRPQIEVAALMKLFKVYLEDAIKNFSDKDIAVKFLGDTSVFPKELRELIETVENNSKGRKGMTLNIAMNYGGRNEILSAVKSLAQKVSLGEIKIEDIKEEDISNNLYTKGQPDPDLIIRPSGEYRTSNFLLWQSAYSEYIILDNVLWPDFSPEVLDNALLEYAKRNRRFGGI